MVTKMFPSITQFTTNILLSSAVAYNFFVALIMTDYVNNFIKFHSLQKLN